MSGSGQSEWARSWKMILCYRNNTGSVQLYICVSTHHSLFFLDHGHLRCWYIFFLGWSWNYESFDFLEGSRPWTMECCVSMPAGDECIITLTYACLYLAWWKKLGDECIITHVCLYHAWWKKLLQLSLYSSCRKSNLFFLQKSNLFFLLWFVLDGNTIYMFFFLIFYMHIYGESSPKLMHSSAHVRKCLVGTTWWSIWVDHRKGIPW